MNVDLILALGTKVFANWVSKKVIWLMKQMIYLQITGTTHTESDRKSGIIFTCAAFTIAICWNNSVFPFDSHSLNTVGKHEPNEKAVFFKLCLTSLKNNYINPTRTGGLVGTCCHTFVTLSLLTLQQNLVNFPTVYLARFWKKYYLEILTMWLPSLPKNYT